MSTIYSLEGPVNANGKVDGTLALPAFAGNPAGYESVVRTVGGAAAGDYTLTLSDPVTDADSTTWVGAASSSNPAKFCGPPVFVGGYSVSADGLTRRVVMTDKNGNPSDGFFVCMVVRTLIG